MKNVEFFDIDAEKRVLAFVINNPKYLHECQEVLSSERTFFDINNSLLYSIIQELDKDAIVISFAKMCISIRNRAIYDEQKAMRVLAEVSETHVSVMDFQSDLMFIEELYRKRTAKLGLQNAILQIDKKASIPEMIDYLADVQKALDIGSKNNVVTSARVVEMAMSILNDPKKNMGVPTGIATLDKLTGGWQNSEVIIIAGRPGMGKTISGINHAIYAAKSDVPVAYITFEVPSEKLIQRALSIESNVPARDIKFKDLTDGQRLSVTNAAKYVSKLPIFFYDYQNSDDIADIAATLKHWKSKHKIGLVIVDYLQLIRDKSIKNTDETAVVTSVSRKMKRLQASLNVPFILLAQLSRATETRSNKRPMMSDIRSSGQIEQDASIVIGLYNDDFYEREKAQADGSMSNFIPTNVLEYHILKNREGELATVAMKIEPIFQRISNLESSFYKSQF